MIGRRGIVEIGQRPTGVDFIHDYSRDVTIVVLGGRVLFELSWWSRIADDVIVDWRDLTRLPAIERREP